MSFLYKTCLVIPKFASIFVLFVDQTHDFMLIFDHKINVPKCYLIIIIYILL